MKPYDDPKDERTEPEQWQIEAKIAELRELQKTLAAAPTPPAQEDEPVAWTGQDGNIEPISNRLRRSRPDLYKHYTIPLSYIRPADDELRKAAEEALYCLRLMAEFHFRGKSESAECHRLADNLLDALEGK